MLFSTFITFGLMAVSHAIPSNAILGFDDLLFIREDGNHQVMKKWEYKIQADKKEVQRRKTLSKTPRDPVPSPSIKRRCDESEEVQIISDSELQGDDVIMSPIVANTGSSMAIVAVAEGYSVANAIEIGTSVSAAFYETVTVSLTVYTGFSWTTTETQTFSYYVPPGQYGVIITNPLIRRIVGNSISGCTDSPAIEPFKIDSHTSATYGNLEWVEGAITLCNSSFYPIPYCVGSGQHE